MTERERFKEVETERESCLSMCFGVKRFPHSSEEKRGREEERKLVCLPNYIERLAQTPPR